MAVFAINMVAMIVWGMLTARGFRGLPLSLIRLAFFVLWIYLIASAYQRTACVLPVIGDLAAKQAGQR